MLSRQWESTYNDNHLKLMRVHIGFMIFYSIVLCCWLYSAIHFGDVDTSPMHEFVMSLFFLPFILLHAALAYGAKRKIELSRKISEIVFAIILLGFPIGTLFSLFMCLPKTVWRTPEL